MAYKKVEKYTEEITDKLTENYSDIISLIGEQNNREGILKTPERASKALQFLTQGYELDGEAILQTAMFQEDYSEMVIVKDIELLQFV